MSHKSKVSAQFVSQVGISILNAKLYNKNYAANIFLLSLEPTNQLEQFPLMCILPVQHSI